MTQHPPDPVSSRNASSLPGDDAAATDPALALADVWDLLDVLPSAAASADRMASTIEMAAVPDGGMLSGTSGGATSGGRRLTQAPAWSTVRQWLPGTALVLAALAAGIAMGRAIAPNPESAILANLPVVQHLDLLREAGSVTFLEAVARGGYPPPRRPPLAQSKADVREDAEEFDAAIAALRAAGGVNVDRETLAERRQQILQMPSVERRQLERSAETFQRLPGVDRSELVAVGRALADPGRDQLLQAARLWHAWVQSRDPADRRDVVELSGEDRLEWLDRWTRLDARLESRQDGREPMRPFFDRERENRRRPPPEFRPGPPPERRPGPPGSPGFWRDDRPPGPFGPPGPPGARDPRDPGPGPVPSVSDPEPPSPAETQAPPS